MHGDYQNCQSAPQRPPKNTPTTANKRNDDGITQLVPQEQRTWSNEDPPKGILSHTQIIFSHHTTHHITHLAHNTVLYQGIIYSSHLENKLSDPTNRHRTDGQT